jgi:metal-responsive CopG/Arc/MetJ family transcriptional regulator
MKTVQMTLDEELLKEVDGEIKKLHTSRSEFTREALRRHLEYQRTKELEKKHIEGYKKNPVTPKEFSSWEAEQVWPD